MKTLDVLIQDRVWDQRVRIQIRNQIEESVWQSVVGRVTDQVRNQVRDKTMAPVVNQIQVFDLTYDSIVMEGALRVLKGA